MECLKLYSEITTEFAPEETVSLKLTSKKTSSKFNSEFDPLFFRVSNYYDFDLDPKQRLHGREGQLFFSDRFLNLTLKRFFKSKNASYKKGIDDLRATRSMVLSYTDLSKFLEIAEIHEEGPDWIIRDFDPSSVPLKKVMFDPTIYSKIQHLKINIKKLHLSEKFKNILNKLNRNPPSENIHWSPQKNKLLIFDMALVRTLKIQTVTKYGHLV